MVGIKSVTIQFLATDSFEKEVVMNDDNWEDKVPKLSKKKPYLWNRSKIVFTDNTVSIGEPFRTSHVYTGIFDRIIISIKRLFK